MEEDIDKLIMATIDRMRRISARLDAVDGNNRNAEETERFIRSIMHDRDPGITRHHTMGVTYEDLGTTWIRFLVIRT